MNPLPIVLAFGAGLLLAYLREGWLRVIGLLVMLATMTAALVTIDGVELVAWAASPGLAVLLLKNSGHGDRLAFEPLMARTAAGVLAVVAALTIAARLPVADQPWGFTAVPVTALLVGVAWLCLKRDEVEAAVGAVLTISGGGALLLLFTPEGGLTAFATGAMCLVPVLAVRGVRPPLPAGAVQGGVLAAAVAVGGLAMFSSVPSLTLADIGLAPTGLVLSAIALALLAASVAPLDRRPGAVLAGALSLLAVAPSLRWAAFIAMLAALLVGRPGREPVAWIGAAVLVLALAVQGGIGTVIGLRWTAVFLAVGLLLVGTWTLRRATGPLLLPVLAFTLVMTVAQLPPGTLHRFQWVAAAGALVLCALGFSREGGRRVDAGPVWARAHLTLGLLLLSVAAANPLGTLAVFLLAIDLAVITPALWATRVGDGFVRGVIALARSGWPPAIAFTGRSIAVIAVWQVTASMGLLAAFLVAASILAPLFDPGQAPGPVEARPSFRRWAVALLSIAAGLTPVALARMLQS